MINNTERQWQEQAVLEAIKDSEQPTRTTLKYECHMSDTQIKNILKRLKEQDKVQPRKHPDDGRKVIYENKVSV